jgi:hypothetical protein
MWRRVDIVLTYVLEENPQAKNQREQVQIDFTWDFLLFSSALKMEAIRSSESQLAQYLHGATFQKTAFFIVTTVKTSNLTYI